MKIEILRYLPLLIIAFVAIWLMVRKWDFITSVLSDNGQGSATRTSGFILVMVVAFNELYTTIKTQKFDYQHLVAILISIGVLFGFIKIVDVIAIWKGNKSNTDDITPHQ